MTSNEIEIIDLAAIQTAVDHGVAYRAVRGALDAIAADAVEAPDELAFVLANGGEMHIKGAHLRQSPWIVFKVASGGFPEGGNAGCSMVLDARTGAPAMILNDNGWLTEMRTAAAGAVAADLLANPGPISVAVLGTGLQARFQVEALRARRQVTEVRVWGRSPGKAEALAAELLAGGVSAAVYLAVGDVVAGANVVVTATSSRAPILSGADLEPGQHVTAMGADIVGKRELDGAVLERATLIAADDLHTASRVGELQHAPEHVGRVMSFASVAAGDGGRRSADDITVADLCGLGVFDAAIAGAVMDRR